MALVRDTASSGRELLHRVAMLLASDLPISDLVEKFARMLNAAMGIDSVCIAIERDGRPYLSYGARGRAGTAVTIFGGSGEVGQLIASWADDSPPSDYDVTLLEAAAAHFGARVQREFEREERERLKQIASTDALTGLANRRTFDETLAREWARCARSGSSLAVLLLDVDFFKLYNDSYGHVAGDACLQRVASAIASCVKRPGDIACRYGGEEFAVILPETHVADAVRVAKSICEAVRNENIAHRSSSLERTTVSIGCAGLHPTASVEPSVLTEAADEQLYRAKEHGRNRTAWEEAIGEAPSAQKLDGPRNNLPAAQNLFFGRDGDLDIMAALIRGCRVLTVEGPGGVGKTRLAIEFARRHASDHGDGVYFIDLAPLGDGSFVAPAMLDALGVPEQRGREAEDTLAEYLTEKHVLLVIDNCETLLDRVAILLERLIAIAPYATFVATSRRSLRIDHEQVYRLSTLQQGDAVALFSSRAQASMPSFSLNAQNIEAVRKICTHLGGIPLAIELAAARVRVLHIDQLEHELSDRAHRRTVDDTIEWSYSILGAEEKLLMRRLSIFAGAFSLDLASAITVSSGDSLDLIDVIGRLIDKSLVQVDPVAGRYWLLESTREFARRMLEKNDEVIALRERYTFELVRLARNAEKRFGSGSGDDARPEVLANYADFRAAMEWSLASGGDAPAGAALVAALGWYWTEGGLWREGRYWLDMALRHSIEEIGDDVAARLLLASAVAYYVQGAFPLMAAEAKRSYEVYARLDDRTGMASAQNLMAIAAQFSGQLQEAHDLWQSVLQASKDVENVRMEGVVLGNLAELLSDWKGDFAESERLYERASQIHRQLANSFPLGVTLGDWSATAAYQGDLRRAERLASEALEIFRGFGEEMRVVEQLIRIAQYRLWAGRADEAKRTLREVVDLLPGCANPLYLIRAAEALSELGSASGQRAEAQALLAFADRERHVRNMPRSEPLTARLHALRDGVGSNLAENVGEEQAISIARTLV